MQCPIHPEQELQQRQNKQTGEVFYSHKQGDSWCNGREKKQTRVDGRDLKGEALATIIRKLDELNKRFDSLAEFLKNG